MRREREDRKGRQKGKTESEERKERQKGKRGTDLKRVIKTERGRKTDGKRKTGK